MGETTIFKNKTILTIVLSIFMFIIMVGLFFIQMRFWIIWSSLIMNVFLWQIVLFYDVYFTGNKKRILLWFFLISLMFICPIIGGWLPFNIHIIYDRANAKILIFIISLFVSYILLKSRGIKLLTCFKNKETLKFTIREFIVFVMVSFIALLSGFENTNVIFDLGNPHFETFLVELKETGISSGRVRATTYKIWFSPAMQEEINSVLLDEKPINLNNKISKSISKYYQKNNILNDKFKVNVSEEEYKKHYIGDKLSIKVHPGFWGKPWVEL